MSIDALKQSEQQSNSDAEARWNERQKRALTADPDVASPESGDTTENKDPSGG